MAAAGPLAEAGRAHHFPPAAPGHAQRRPCGSEVSRAPAAPAPPPRLPLSLWSSRGRTGPEREKEPA